MKLSPKTKLVSLLRKYPFLKDFLSDYNRHFAVLKSPATMAALGAGVTLQRLAAVCGADLSTLMSAIAKQVFGVTGERIPLKGLSPEYLAKSNARIQAIKKSFMDLHQGQHIAAAERHLQAVTEEIEPHEIAAVGHVLADEGITTKRLLRLCDLHASVLGEVFARTEHIEVLPGHPMNTYIRENERIQSLITVLSRLKDEMNESDIPGDRARCFAEMKKTVSDLKAVETHYARKENHLFPFFERHGLTKPPHVTWETHDTVRDMLRNVIAAVEAADCDAACNQIPALKSALLDMIDKENRVVFPMALSALTAQEWVDIRKSDDALGYDIVAPEAEWAPNTARGAPVSVQPDKTSNTGPILLTTGELTPMQIDLIFGHLPLDISFVDEYDDVRYFNNREDRVFPRGHQVIGRKVQYCHPPKSLPFVNRILSEFRRGNKDEAEFWMQVKDKYIHARYIAVRNDTGDYRGCLEIFQDITHIRTIKGEKRLLGWRDEP
ncbi:MAG: DUF438 domain-containing protein [Myxococcota bacterium]|nr:DUF438 domain-containing protein [Myxococcota bacterium]